MTAFAYGAVLKVQREFSLEDIRTKLDEMKRCGMNTVVIWPAVFWWENRANVNYPYQTGIEILKYAEQIDIQIIMELAGQITSLEYAPDFLMKEDYYTKKLDGTYDNTKVVFDYLNYNHPEVKQLIKKNFMEVARVYKGYKALYGYDILNEAGFTSYDRYTLQLYREWLENKYGTIERLNEVWDRVYYSWHQIEFNFWQWPSVMPLVDWQQFRKANIGMILNEWRSNVKAVDPDRPTIADNINSMVATDQFYNRPHDDWNAAANVDEYGISFYPKENLEGTPHYKRWQTFVGVHSATKTGRFWISELQSHHRNMFNPSSIVYPHELKWWAWEAISHGAKGLIYWKWDPFIKGNQTAGRGLVDTKGKFTPRADAAAKIASLLQEHAREFTTYVPEQPRVAIVYDKLTHDFTKSFTLAVPSETSIYLNSIAGLFECLWELNIAAKFITPEDVLSGEAMKFQTLFLTNQLVVGPDLAQALQQFVQEGGTVIADGKFGEIREDGVLNEDLPGGALNAELGYRLVDVDPLDLEIYSDNAFIPGHFERKMLHIESNVEVWGSYSDGYPAVIRTAMGKGSFIYISTMLWYGYHKSANADLLNFVKKLDEKFGLSLHTSQELGLKICTLRGNDGLLLFAYNYSNATIASEIRLREIGTKLEYTTDLTHQTAVSTHQDQDQVTLKVQVPKKDVAIYKLSWRG